MDTRPNQLRTGGQSVVCIAGMHRSGTSMITRMLNLCGMSLGEEQAIMPPSPDNPEGYWEHYRCFHLNRAILQDLMGAWDCIPQYSAHWTQRPSIRELEPEARAIIQTFESAPVWGWKDPSNSLVLPFWRELLPEMKVLVCLRNPLDVANSLNRRGSSSLLFGLQLWWTYNLIILRETTPQQRIVVHYDRLLTQPREELVRVCGLVGLTPTQEMLDAACATARTELRHCETGLRELENECPWKDLVRTYARLLCEMGDHNIDAQEFTYIQSVAAGWVPDESIYQSREELIRKISMLQDVFEQYDAQRRRNLELVAEITSLNDAIAMLAQERDTIRHERNLAREAHNTALAQLGAIQNSKSWRILTKVGAVVAKTQILKPSDRPADT